MSYKSNNVEDSDSSMFTANSDTLTADDSSFNTTGNLTDITGDRSFLIDLNSPPDSTMSSGRDKPASSLREEQLFGGSGLHHKSTPIKPSRDSESLISREKGEDETDAMKSEDVRNKRKRSDSDDSVIIVIEDSVNSGDQSDLDTSNEDESEPLNDRRPNNMKIANIDDNLPDTVRLLRGQNGAKVYIIGTAHFSEESQNDVSKIIQSVRPHIVVLELCQQRINILTLDEKTILEEAKNIDFQKIRLTVQQNGLFNGLMYILLLNMSAHITKELGMAPGGEFRRAVHEAKRIGNIIIQVGDRPIQVTMHRALSALSWWQTLRLGWHLLTSKDPISKEEVERCKQQDLLKEMLAEIAGDYPALEKVFVKERDIYLTHSMQTAAAYKGFNEPMRVVGVVGIGHVQGIVDNWGKVSSRQIPGIMKIPPPSLPSRIFKVSIKVAFVGLIVYAGYKVIPKKWLP